MGERQRTTGRRVSIYVGDLADKRLRKSKHRILAKTTTIKTVEEHIAIPPGLSKLARVRSHPFDITRNAASDVRLRAWLP